MVGCMHSKLLSKLLVVSLFLCTPMQAIWIQQHPRCWAFPDSTLSLENGSLTTVHSNNCCSLSLLSTSQMSQRKDVLFTVHSINRARYYTHVRPCIAPRHITVARCNGSVLISWARQRSICLGSDKLTEGNLDAHPINEHVWCNYYNSVHYAKSRPFRVFRYGNYDL